MISVRARAIAWLTAMAGSDGSYRFSPESEPSLVGTTCAVLAAEVLGGLPQWPLEARARTADYIRRWQREDGWFEDPLLEPSPEFPLSREYLRGHATFLAVMALDALQTRPAHELRFLDRWREDDETYRWVDALDWANPWRESNWVEWVGTWLLADAGLRPRDVPIAPERYPAGFGGILKWLREHQDPKTGFWGDPPGSSEARLLGQMAAAFHHYVFFYATDTLIPHADRIVDHTLALQQEDGLFTPGKAGGGPCEDLDAIDILANMHRLNDYRRRDIEKALMKAVRALLRNQRANGAFVSSAPVRSLPFWRVLVSAFVHPGRPGGPRTRWRVARLRYRKGQQRKMTCYAGCKDLPFDTMGGDMFSQWFRPLGIAIACQILGPARAPVWWNFGFRDQITQGWWPGASSDAVPGRTGK